MTRICLLGVVRAVHPSVARSRTAPVRFVVGRAVAAAVRDIDERPALRLRDMRAHVDGVTDLFARGPILPFRFPTVVETEDAVATLLHVWEGAYCAELDRLDGMCEISVTVSESEDEALRDLLDGDRSLRRLSVASRRRGRLQDMVGLGELVHAALARRRRAIAAELRRRLAPLVVEVVERPAGAPTTARVSVLARTPASTAVAEAAAALERDTGGRLEAAVSEPLPPFSFVRAPATVPAAPVGRRSRWAS